MFQEGIARGEAHVVVEVGLDGTLTDSLIVLYTHRAFADEALRVARASRYAAGSINGQPFISILQLQFHFDTERMVVTQHVGLNPEPPEPRTSRFEYHAQTLAALDRRPNALHTPGPVYPQAWIDAGRRGTITVAFYLDEQGRVRLPVARDPHDELLAASACAAVKDWRFEPPLRRGKPVLVRVELPIVFHPEATASPPRSD
jgi:TonB family protein